METERPVRIHPALYGPLTPPRGDPRLTGPSDANHRFNAEEGDWGFTRFCELRKLFNHTYENTGKPFIENDEAYLTAYVRVVKDPTGVLWHSFQKCVSLAQLFGWLR